MHRRRPRRELQAMRRSRLIGLGALAIATSFACSAPAPDPAEPLAIDQVVYVGETTDEALLRLLDAEASDVAAQRLLIVAPEAASVQSRSTPLAIEFRVPTTARLRHPQRPTRGWLRRAVGWLSPIATAYAHGTPFNGAGYLLVLRGADGGAALELFTDATTYAPSIDVWTTLADAAQPLTLSVTYAWFEDNAIPVGGGPFVGGDVEFRIE